jgi:hypothetical protein
VKQALREAGHDFGREFGATAGLQPARKAATGLEQMCAALGSLGFHVSLRSFEGDRAELASATCPLRPLIVKSPEAADIDQGMWAGLAERGVRGVSANRVTCETPRCQSVHDDCQFLLSLRA